MAPLGRTRGSPLPPTFNVVDIPPLEVARQITLLEEALFKAIQPRECLNQAWNKPGRERNAPHIVAMIRRCNELSWWISTRILRCRDIRQRTAALRYWLRVARELRDLHNFNGVVEIIATLHNAAVQKTRLRRSWEVRRACAHRGFPVRVIPRRAQIPGSGGGRRVNSKRHGITTGRLLPERGSVDKRECIDLRRHPQLMQSKLCGVHVYGAKASVCTGFRTCIRAT